MLQAVGDEQAFPDTYARRKHFLEILWKMRREGESGSLDAENFLEAKTALARSLQRTEVMWRSQRYCYDFSERFVNRYHGMWQKFLRILIVMTHPAACNRSGLYVPDYVGS